MSLNTIQVNALESEAIYIFREVVAQFEKPALLFSGGKDSVTLVRLAQKAFYPAKIPFPLMHYLERLDVDDFNDASQTRFPVQTVIRPKTEKYHDYRGYAGKIYGGDFQVGDEVTVLPSLTKSKIKTIHFFDKEYEIAKSGSSITISLADNVNVSRGDMLVKTDEEPEVTKQLEATICWMDKEPLQASQKYYIKHGVNDAQAKIMQLSSIIKTDFSGKEKHPTELQLNQIGDISLKLSKPLAVDKYNKNKANGSFISFILINPKTNNTVGVGFIR